METEGRRVTNEQKLWLTVIHRAQEEADGRYLYVGNIEMLKYRARKWLVTETRSFWKVCALAGFSEQETRELLEHNRRKYGVKK